MEHYSGEDLLKTFEKLNINLGHLSPTVIEAWFDTDCVDILNFLNWLCQLSEENVISAIETEEYKQLCETNRVLEGDEYKSALTDVESQYPGILAIEENTFEIECMKDEISMLLEEEKSLENVISEMEKLDVQLCGRMEAAKNEEARSIIRRENAEEECLKLAQKLDQINTEIHQQIIKCSDELINFEYAAKPCYISHMPLDQYTTHCNGIFSKLSSFITRECSIYPKMGSAVKSCTKLTESVFENASVDDTLSTLKYRLFKSIQNKNYAEVTRHKLMAEINFLNAIHVPDFVNRCVTDHDLKTTLENSISYMKLKIDEVTLELENLATEASEYYINLPKLHFVQNEMKLCKAKLLHIETMDAKVTEILSYNILLCMMFMSNNSDIKQLDKFFRDVHHYITHDLRDCHLRTEAMIERINDHNAYKGIPFEKKNSLIKAVLKILYGKEVDSSEMSAVQLFNRFEREQRILEAKLFDEELKEHRKLCRDIETDTRLLQSFLRSGPTLCYVTLPYNLYKAFSDVLEVIESEKAAVSSAVQISNDASKKLSDNKWLRIRRQLWMYFITEPKKVPQFIKEIEAEVKRIRNET